MEASVSFSVSVSVSGLGISLDLSLVLGLGIGLDLGLRHARSLRFLNSARLADCKITKLIMLSERREIDESF